MGPRQFSPHAIGDILRVCNWVHVKSWQLLSSGRPVLSRFSSVTNGPLNYGAVFVWITFGFCLMARLQFDRRRDALYFNAQDNPEFWF